MIDYASNPRRYDNIAIIYLMLGLAAILLASVFASPNFLGDERYWNKIAWLWAQGHPPYSIIGDNKLPGIFYIHRLSNWLFPGNPFFPRLIAVLLQLGGALAVYGITWRILNRRERLWCLAAYVAIIATPSTDVGNGGTTEAFMHPFCALAFLFYSLRRGENEDLRASLLAGLAMGMAICFRQSAATSLLALMCWPLLEHGLKRGWKESLSMLVAASAINALIVLPILIQGTTVSQFLDAIGTKTSVVPDPGRVLFVNWYVWQEWVLPLAFIGFMLCRRREAWPFLLWLAADCLAVNVTGNYFSHQFKQLVPSFAVCSGLAVAAAFKEKSPSSQYRILMILVTLFFILDVVLTLLNLNR